MASSTSITRAPGFQALLGQRETGAAPRHLLTCALRQGSLGTPPPLEPLPLPVAEDRDESWNARARQNSRLRSSARFASDHVSCCLFQRFRHVRLLPDSTKRPTIQQSSDTRACVGQ